MDEFAKRMLSRSSSGYMGTWISTN